MIDLYYWPTPNGWKITIMLEETGLDHKIIPVNIGKGEQFKPEFLKISPNNRMPAIVDQAAEGGPLSVFESGAILTYLADKTGRFIPRDTRGRFKVLEWLFWQVGGLGPMAGQANHFRAYAPEPIQYAIDRYTKEVNRLFGVMNIALRDSEHLAGDYSIADMASFPWVVPYERMGQSLDEFPHLKRWFDAMKARPAVERGLAVGKELSSRSPMDDEAKKILLGQMARKE